MPLPATVCQSPPRRGPPPATSARRPRSAAPAWRARPDGSTRTRRPRTPPPGTGPRARRGVRGRSSAQCSEPLRAASHGGQSICTGIASAPGRRSSSSASVVPVSRTSGASGRSSARRSSPMASCISTRQRSRSSSPSQRGQLLELGAVCPRRPNPAAIGVGDEDRRAAHRGQAADHLADTVVELGWRRCRCRCRPAARRTPPAAQLRRTAMPDARWPARHPPRPW